MPRATSARGRVAAVARAAALAGALVLAGCGGRQLLPLEAPVPPEDCGTLYVLAPGNYIVDLAGGADVVLDPAVHEFPLFCSPGAAARALAAALDQGRLPPGDWRVFRLDGSFAELAGPAGAGADSPYALARQARLADWVSGETDPPTENEVKP